MSLGRSRRPQGGIGSMLSRLFSGGSPGARTEKKGGEFSRPTHAPLRGSNVTLPARPLVSVVMTSHDTAAHVEAAVQSILRQSWDHLELVVVDDASRDDSLARLKALCALDERMHVVPLPSNVGTYRAKNAGIRSARGDVLTFMDSDDTSHPARIEQQLELLRAPGVVASTCNYVRHSSDGDVIMNRGLRERRALISLMIKRGVIDDIGWFDSVRTSADDEFFERIRHVYGRGAVAHVDRALYFALSRKGSLSTTPGMAVDLSADGEGPSSPLSAVRQAYVQSYREWYARLESAGMRPYMPRTLLNRRPFPADPRLIR